MKLITDIRALRIRARNHVPEPTPLPDSANAGVVIPLLNDALAAEIMCVQRYQRHSLRASEISFHAVEAEFLQHANEEQTHVARLVRRIIELGGEPDLSPDGSPGASYFEYVEGQSLTDMITENLIAERIAIDSYQQIIIFLGDDDPTTKRLLEDILANEEEHAQDLTHLLNRPMASTPQARPK